jgi:hypothetical protein
MSISFINGIGNSLGISNLNQNIASIADGASAFLDGGALAIDTSIVALEVTAAVIGGESGVAACPLCSPITGPVGSILGFEIVDVATKPLLGTANAMAGASTLATATSDLLTGESSIEIYAHGNARGAYANIDGYVGQDTYISTALTVAGSIAPNAPASIPFQAGSVANDLGLFHQGPKLINMGNQISRFDRGLGTIVKSFGQGVSLLPSSIPFSFKNLTIWK